MNIIILTGSELRHSFFRKALAMNPVITVIQSYCEQTNNRYVPKEKNNEDAQLQIQHLEARERSEEDFFKHFTEFTPDHSNPVFIPLGTVNNKKYQQEMLTLNPDLIISFGSSILTEPLLSHFEKKILTVNLGLQPYFLGPAKNFWALVHGIPECVGATFLYMNSELDNGKIIHQIRGRIFPDDDPHQIGNRLIADMTKTFITIITYLNTATSKTINTATKVPISFDPISHVTNDFSAESVKKLYNNFKNGMIKKYIQEKEKRDKKYPLLSLSCFS